jgi:hypothetical protein
MVSNAMFRSKFDRANAGSDGSGVDLSPDVVCAGSRCVVAGW